MWGGRPSAVLVELAVAVALPWLWQVAMQSSMPFPLIPAAAELLPSAGSGALQKAQGWIAVLQQFLRRCRSSG